MRGKLLAVFIAATAAVFLWSTSVSALGLYPSDTVGNDLSWPNCSTAYTTTGRFGIVGATDGLGYSTNPCIAKEASSFPNLSLYINTGWDSSSSHIDLTSPRLCNSDDYTCLAYNYGYNAGLYAYAAAQSARVRSSTWWLDVETTNTWSADSLQNRSSLEGEHDALLSKGVAVVGIYSTTVQWKSVTGAWLNGWPSWGATAVNSAKQAASYCTGHQFTAGQTWLIQFSGTIDQDYAC